MMNADVTAENKPDWAKPHSKRHVPSDSQSPALWTRMNTHKDERGIQIFIISLLEVPVVFFYFALELVVELYPGVETGSSAAQHRLQGIPEGLLQSFAVR